MKKTVVYDASKGVDFVGNVAFVVPLDHPDTNNVSNNHVAMTSRVIRKMVDGEFETKNTIYVPNVRQDPFVDKV